MKGKSPVWMILCCVVPLGLAVGLYYAGWISESWMFILIMLLCPLFHFLVMKGHGHEGETRQGPIHKE